MSNSDHKSGVREGCLVTRQVKLEHIDAYHLSPLLGKLEKLYGVETVLFDKAGKRLTVSYDASHCQFHFIKRMIESHNFTLARDWWSCLTASYYSFVDQNIKDNANHEPICCNKPPSGSRKQ